MAKPENEITWRDLEIGFVITEPGNSKCYRTGDWKTMMPVLDRDRCVHCGLCYIYCPDMAYAIDADGFFVADLNFCKGCGICAYECPTKAISMVQEEEEE